MKKQLLLIWTFARIDIKRLFRDRVAIFFVFIFPLLFLIIFGAIFRNGDDITFRLGVVNQSDSQFSKSFVEQIQQNRLFEIDDRVTSLAQAREKMNRGQLEATLVLPPGFGDTPAGRDHPSGEALILYDKNNESAGMALGSVFNLIFDRINEELVGPGLEPFAVRTESTATKDLTRFDYTFSGILGFTLLSLGIFGPVTVFPRLKQRGVLRRYHATPLKVWQYFVGNVASNAVVGLMAVAFMFTAAVLLFDLSMRGNYLVLALMVVLSTIMLFGIGLALGGWAKNENQAQPLAQLVALPMMFLSGVFFPTFLMPELLQDITKYIPLTPVIDSVRLIITENASLVDLTPQLGIILTWTLVTYLIAFKVFRWE